MKNINLTPEQEERAWQSLSKMNASGLTPEETHFFVDMYNWDAVFQPLFDIIRSESCEKATACLIYWRADPSAFYDGDYDPEELSKEVYSLIQEIEQKYVSGFYKQQNISFDPEEEGVAAVKDWPEVAQHIPKELMKPVKANSPHL